MSWEFFKEFIANWRHTGALFPSSKLLARVMIDLAEVERADRVLELGPGTGPFTHAISEKIKPEARYLGLEINQSFTASLKQLFPELQFECTPAQSYDFSQFLHEGENFDTIVSGLPWTAFPHDLQVAILDHALSRLRPGGRMVTFAYAGFHLLPSGRHFAGLLASRCAKLARSSIIWPNLMPALIYIAQMPE